MQMMLLLLLLSFAQYRVEPPLDCGLDGRCIKSNISARDREFLRMFRRSRSPEPRDPGYDRMAERIIIL